MTKYETPIHDLALRLDEDNKRLRAERMDILARAAQQCGDLAREFEGRQLRSEAMGEPDEAKYQEAMARAAWRCAKVVSEMKLTDEGVGSIAAALRAEREDSLELAALIADRLAGSDAAWTMPGAVGCGREIARKIRALKSIPAPRPPRES